MIIGLYVYAKMEQRSLFVCFSSFNGFFQCSGVAPSHSTVNTYFYDSYEKDKMNF